MSQKQTCLASDNCSSVHPQVIEAIIEANQGPAPSYGSDPWTERAHECMQKAFGRSCKMFIVPTGTGANVFALRLACRRHESVICTDIAHLYTQECGASESLVGCKLLPIFHQNGKLTPESVLKKLRSEKAFGLHSTLPRVLSITQPTEVGTVYTLEELKSLSKLCREEGLLFHVDGSRLYNAAVALGANLHEMVSGVDLLSLGGTKNGLMGAESLLIFNANLYEGSDHLHKQTLQLLSKMRFVSAQYIPFFADNLWHTLATHANHKAQEIASLIKGIPHLTLSYAVETNQVFFTAPASWIPRIQEKIFCYVWDPEKNELRFIASWNTLEQDVKDVKLALMEIAQI